MRTATTRLNCATGILVLIPESIFERYRFTKHAIAEGQGPYLTTVRVRLPAMRSDICRPAANKTIFEIHHPMMSVLAQ